MQLQKDETILLTLRPKVRTAWYWFIGRSWRVILTVVALIVIVGMNTDASPYANMFGLPRIYLVGLGLFVTVLMLLLVWYHLVSLAYRYIITNKRIILKYGLLSLNTRIIPYRQVADVTMHASFFERLCGLRSVNINTIGTLLGGLRPNRRRVANNTTRLEGLSAQECERALVLISQQMD